MVDFETINILLSSNILKFFLLFGVLLIYYRWYRRPNNFPPGPRGIPILGAVPWLSKNPAKTFAAWSNKYGSILSVRMGSEDWIILNDYESIHEAFVGSKENFSGRPILPVFEQITKGHGIVFIDYGPRWKSQRTFGLKTLRGLGVGKKSMEERVQEEVSYLNQAILEHDGKPFNIFKQLTNAVSNNICNVCFGQRYEYTDKQFTAIIRHICRRFNDPSENSLNMILALAPILIHFPPFRQMNQRTMNDVSAILDLLKEIIEDHKATYDDNAPRDFIDAFMAEMNRNNDGYFTDFQLLNFVGDLFVAGTETTTSTLRWAILCLIHYPHCQQRLYEEIKTVVGTETLVGMSHKADMSYTCAFIEELYRFRTLGPLGVPHKTNEDAALLGYKIPKGVQVMSNLWAVHNNPEYFEEPEKFKPERHLDSEGKFQKSKYVIPFSVGPRHCLGEQLARMEVFIFLVCLVQKFKFKASNADGSLPEIKKGSLGLAFVPLQFDVVAVER